MTETKQEGSLPTEKQYARKGSRFYYPKAAACPAERRPKWLLRVGGGWLLTLLSFGGALPAPAQARMPLPLSQVQILGHAGAGFFTPIHPFNASPPSSWRGIEWALGHGADGVEIDLQLSQDSVVVLYHNTDLPSMTTARTGCVSTTTASAITGLRYRGGWPYDWLQRERPQRLDSVLSRLARRPGFPLLHLDLHETDDCTPYGDGRRSRTLVRQLRRLLRQYQVPLERVLVLTNQPQTLVYLRQQLPQLPLGLEITEDFARGLNTAQALGMQAVVLSKYVVTPERRAAAHAAGLQVVIFGGRSPRAIRRLLASRPDAVEVDNVRQLVRLRRQARQQGSRPE